MKHSNFKFMQLMISVFLLVICNKVNAQEAKVWSVDHAHSVIDFTVTHFFTPVNGTFDKFDLNLKFDPNDLDHSQIDVSISVSSVNTRNERRDNHLKSPDFFDAEKYPAMSFKSSKIVKAQDGFIAKGVLQIKDVKKEIELPFKLLGIKELPEVMSQRMGGVKEIGSFHASYKINRTDYKVGIGNWASTVVVGDEVDIEISIEADYSGL